MIVKQVILGEISKGKVNGSELMGNRLRNIGSSENVAGNLSLCI